jgi:type II restriction/modification system DNA methylase subunit YeeA
MPDLGMPIPMMSWDEFYKRYYSDLVRDIMGYDTPDLLITGRLPLYFYNKDGLTMQFYPMP